MAEAPIPTGVQWENQSEPSINNVENAAQIQNRLSIQEALETAELYKVKPTFTDSVWDTTTLWANGWDYMAGPTGTHDENYTDDLWKKDLDEAVSKGLDPYMASTLSGAVSQAHMWQLVDRAKAKQEQLRVIADASAENFAGTMAGVMFINMFDPAGIVIGTAAGAAAGGLAGAGVASAKALYHSYATARKISTIRGASNSGVLAARVVAGGAAGSAVPEYINQQLNQVPVSNMDIMFAAAAGTALSAGAVGLGMARARNPRAFEMMADAGRKSLAEIGVRASGVTKKAYSVWNKEGLANAATAKEADAIMDPVPGYTGVVPDDPGQPSVIEPTSRTIPHPKFEGVELPVDEAGWVILYRGSDGKPSIREGKPFINFSKTPEEAEGNGPHTYVIRIRPEDVGKLVARRDSNGKVDPNEQNFGVPRALYETLDEKPWVRRVPTTVDAPPVDPPLPVRQDISEMSFNAREIGDQFGVEGLPDVTIKASLGDAAPDAAPEASSVAVAQARAFEEPTMSAEVSAQISALEKQILMRKQSIAGLVVKSKRDPKLKSELASERAKLGTFEEQLKSLSTGTTAKVTDVPSAKKISEPDIKGDGASAPAKTAPEVEVAAKTARNVAQGMDPEEALKDATAEVSVTRAPPVEFPGRGLMDLYEMGPRLKGALRELDKKDLEVIAKSADIKTSGKSKRELIKEIDDHINDPSKGGAQIALARAENVIADPAAKGDSSAGAKKDEFVREDYRSYKDDPDARAYMAANAEPKSAFPLENVPILKHLYRIDLTGILGRSNSGIVRALAHELGNEVVGLEGGAKTPTGAYIRSQKQWRVWQVQVNQVFEAQFPKYLEYIGRDNNVITRLKGSDAYQTFQEEIYDYVRGYGPDNKQFPDGVAEVGEAMRKANKDILDMAKENNLRWANEVEADPTYMWRKHDDLKWREAEKRLGEAKLIELFTKGFKQANEGLTNADATQLARRYVKSSLNRNMGRVDDWSMAFGKGNYIELKRILTDEGMDPEMAQGIMDRIRVDRREPVGNPNLKRRALIDEEAFVGTPEGGAFSIHQLMDKNAMSIFDVYSRRMAGDIALAKVRITDPRDGTVIVDGIRGDDEFDKLLRWNRDWHIEQRNAGVRQYEVKTKDGTIDFKTGPFGRRENESLRFIYDRVKGVPDNRYAGSTLYQAMDEWRRFNSMRLMGQVGVAQLGETTHPIAHLSLMNAMQNMPAVKRIVEGDKSILNSEFFQFIENIGIAGERLQGNSMFNTVDETAEHGMFPFQKSSSRLTRELQKLNRQGEQLVYEGSGMSGIQQQQFRMVAASFIANMAINGKGLLKNSPFTRGNKQRLLQLGIDEDTAKAIQWLISNKGEVIDKGALGVKIDTLNAHLWGDVDNVAGTGISGNSARIAMEEAAFKAAHKFIQSNDPTNSAWFMPHPIAKLIFQFRSFPMTAYANQFLYNLHTMDAKSASAFFFTTVMASVARAAQVHANSLGKSPAVAERYKKKYLDPVELAKAGFERAGWASILPMVIDTGASLMGQDAVFNARSSGQPTEVFGGFPGKSMFDNLSRGMAGLTRTAMGGQTISEGEARALTRLLPFQNLWGISQALDAMVSPLPDKAPYKRRSF